MDIGNSDAISRASSSTVDGKASEAVAMLGQNPNCDPNGLDSCCPQDAPIIQEFSRNVDRFFDKHNLNNNPDIAHPEHLAAAMANTVLVRLRRRDDQTTLADDQAHPFQQGNPKSHPGDGSGGDDAGNPANSKKRRIGRDPDIPLGIKIALSKDCTSDLLEEIRAAAAVSLSDTKITIRDRNRNIQKVLVTPSARESTDTFFGPDMLGGLFRRLNNIIREADDYNTEMLGGHCDICDDLKELLSRYHLPSEIEMVCRSLAHLNVASAHQPELDSLGSVLYIMHLVRLNNAWAEGLQSLSRGNTAWLERINMLPQRGTNSSQLKEKICGMMDTKPAQRQSMFFTAPQEIGLAQY
ncbi:hypothetical protein QBC34DRAFT_426208 [Podospora aff. communis PSN243]|uniref:Uncharacterized protein n=1 Tax=Podospora aff. communis PSN243 TaxID=3040156 RepID=A0AAV9GKQ9_9PEZI|nr:hypothetical protein QBC34DRAFT_426208 [Podospora aff. communis PSN243]